MTEAKYLCNILYKMLWTQRLACIRFNPDPLLLKPYFQAIISICKMFHIHLGYLETHPLDELNETIKNAFIFHVNFF